MADESDLRDEIARLKARIAELEQSTRHTSVDEIFSELALAIVVITPPNKIAYINTRATEFAGYSLAELQASNYMEVIHPDHREQITSLIASYLQQDHAPTYMEYQYLHKDGRVLQGNLMIQNIIYKGQRAVLLSGNDITHQKRLETDSMRYRIEREKNQHLQEFVAGASIGIRNPLSTINNAVYILRRDNPDSRQLDIISDQVSHLEELLDDLMLIIRLENHPINTLFPVSLNRLLDELHTRYISRAKTQGITWWVKNVDAILLVNGDEVHLTNALANLIENAFNHTPEGGTIEFIARHYGNQAVITLSDTGNGIRAEDLPLIFDRFFQGQHTTASNKGGRSGLGLSITRKIIDQHGGNITADSVPGEGTLFTISLPLMDN